MKVVAIFLEIILYFSISSPRSYMWSSMMGLEQQLVMSEPGLISIDNDLAVSKRIYQSLGLMFRDDPDNLFACFTTFITIK